MKKLLLIALLFCLKQLNAQCSLTITGNTVICAGTTTTLTASAAANYTWMPSGAQTATIAITPTASVVYTVTAVTGTCTATNTISVTVNPIPTMTVTSPVPYCPGALVSSTDYNITTDPFGVTYTWTATNQAGTGMPTNGTGAAPGSSYVAPANPSLVNQVSVISYTPSLNGCIGIPVTDTVIIKPTPIMTAMMDQYFCPGMVTNAVPLSSMPTTPSTTYVWSFNSGGIPNVGSTNPIPSFYASNAGLTTLSTAITVTPTLNGCVGPPSGFSIYINPNPIAKFSANMFV
ncbi:MAG TPA: PKD-like domain-containing protein, partial [Bacteroidia bacterium]|nr:PKD-like domain-containing protein [Bacteroidia bacterium]